MTTPSTPTVGSTSPTELPGSAHSSSNPTPSTPPVVPNWPVLSLIERRILGVLCEKSKTTPQVYPLSLNALTTGCNQKSNRDPIMELTENQVENILDQLMRKKLVAIVQSSRVDRWKHELYDLLKVNKLEMAIITELLLRDMQTEGELRAHTARFEPVGSLDDLRKALKPLLERRLVFYASGEKERGAVLTHGFRPPEETAKLSSGILSKAPSSGQSLVVPHEEMQYSSPSKEFEKVAIAPMKDEIDSLRSELKQLQLQMAGLQKDFLQLRQDWEDWITKPTT